MDQEEDTGKVVDTAWGFFASTIASADSLKRYQGLRSALRMMVLQVIPLIIMSRHSQSCLPGESAECCSWGKATASQNTPVGSGLLPGIDGMLIQLSTRRRCALESS